MKTAQRDRAVSSFLRGVPLEAALVTTTATITQEACFVRSIATFHAGGGTASVQLKGRSSSGTTVARIVFSGVGNQQYIFKQWILMQNGFALSLAGATGSPGQFGGMATYVRLSEIPWLRDLDRPTIAEVYARAATISEVSRG